MTLLPLVTSSFFLFLFLQNRLSCVFYVTRSCDKHRPGSYCLVLNKKGGSTKGYRNCSATKRTQCSVGNTFRFPHCTETTTLPSGPFRGLGWLKRDCLSELLIKNRKSSHHTQMSADAWLGGVSVTASFWFHPSACPFICLTTPTSVLVSPS